MSKLFAYQFEVCPFVDHETGSSVEVGGAVADVVFSGQAVVVADGDGGAKGFLLPSASTPGLPAFEPILIDPLPDPEAVVREFYAAMTAGDPKRISDLIAVDAVFGTVFEGDTWFSLEARNQFWARVDFFNELSVDISVGPCEQMAAGTSTLVSCEISQTDEFLEALGTEIRGSALLAVESGLISIFRSERRLVHPLSRGASLINSPPRDALLVRS